MSYVKHNAIIVTSCLEDRLEQARGKAIQLDLTVTPCVRSTINGYETFVIVPDGSKEGWDESEVGDRKREMFLKWIESQSYEDGSSPFDVVHVEYGELKSGVCGQQIANSFKGAHVDRGKPLTLRRLIEIVGTEYLDVPISIHVHDPHLNFESVQLTEDWPPRHLPRGPEERGSLMLKAHISKGLVKPRSK